MYYYWRRNCVRDLCYYQRKYGISHGPFTTLFDYTLTQGRSRGSGMARPVLEKLTFSSGRLPQLPV